MNIKSPRSPALSVIIPIYNCGKFLADAIKSIRQQTFGDFECLLCDASDDGSSDFLRELAIRDPRLRIIRQAKSTLGQALQEGLLSARAPFVARMDADDIALPQRFAVQVAHMQTHPELLALGSAIQYMDADGNLGRTAVMPRKKDIPVAILWGCPIAHPTAMFRRDASLKAGGYRALFPFWEDYDLWLRLSRLGPLDNIPQVLVRYRMHGGNSVEVHAAKGRPYAIAAQAAYLLALKTGRDPLDGEQALPAPERLLAALPKRERLLLLGRMLACTAHFIGDEEEDALGREWLEELRAAMPDSRIREILGVFHMRCVKRYARRSFIRALKHFFSASFFAPATVAAMCGKLFMQYIKMLKLPLNTPPGR